MHACRTHPVLPAQQSVEVLHRSRNLTANNDFEVLRMVGEVMMDAYTSALPLSVERAVETQRPEQSRQSVQNRYGIVEFDRCEIGREAYPASDYRAAGIGSVIVAGAWFAFYVIAALHSVAFATN